MAETLRPNADVNTGAWTTEAGGSSTLYAQIDESSANDADYIRSPLSPTSSLVEVALTNTTASTVGSGAGSIHVRYQKASDGPIFLICRLKQGSTTITSANFDNVSAAVHEASITIATAEVANITDPWDLRLQYEARASAPVAGDTLNGIRGGTANTFKVVRNTALTSVISASTVTLSMWAFLPTSVTTNTVTFFRERGTAIQILSRDQGRLQIITKDTIEGYFDEFVSSSLVLSPLNAWHHIMFSFDCTGGSTRTAQIYVDDEEVALSASSSGSNGPAYALGWAEDGSADVLSPGITGQAVAVGELFVTYEKIDISVEANRRKFISAGGAPVDLGSDGTTPTGTRPIIYLTARNGVADTFLTNRGFGGNFTTATGISTTATNPAL